VPIEREQKRESEEQKGEVVTKLLKIYELKNEEDLKLKKFGQERRLPVHQAEQAYSVPGKEQI
jgi:hypothetical protein